MKNDAEFRGFVSDLLHGIVSRDRIWGRESGIVMRGSEGSSWRSEFRICS